MKQLAWIYLAVAVVIPLSIAGFMLDAWIRSRHPVPVRPCIRRRERRSPTPQHRRSDRDRWLARVADARRMARRADCYPDEPLYQNGDDT